MLLTLISAVEPSAAGERLLEPKTTLLLTLISLAASALLSSSVPFSWAPLSVRSPAMSAPTRRSAPLVVLVLSRSTPPPTFMPSASNAHPWLSLPFSTAPRKRSRPVMSAPAIRTAPAAVNPPSRLTRPPTLMESANSALLPSSFPSIPFSWAPLSVRSPAMSAPTRRSAPLVVLVLSRPTPPPTFMPSASNAHPWLSLPFSTAPRKRSRPVMSAPAIRTAPAAVNPPSRLTRPPTLMESANSALLPSSFPSIPFSWAPLSVRSPAMSAPTSLMAPAEETIFVRFAAPRTFIQLAASALASLSLPFN